ncbi:membrane-spanning 4-domains subfamily A member 6C-like [Rhynchocyon petersi]
MIPQPLPNDTIMVLTSSGIKFPQTETSKPTAERQDNLMKRVKAEIKVLGTIQIMCGLLVLSLGLILAFSSTSPQFTPVLSILLKASYPFLGALCFVVSGSLSIITEKKASKILVQSSLMANSLSCLSAVVGVILLSINVFHIDSASRECDMEKESVPTPYYNFYYHRFEEKECFVITASVTAFVENAFTLYTSYNAYDSPPAEDYLDKKVKSDKFEEACLINEQDAVLEEGANLKRRTKQLRK